MLTAKPSLRPQAPQATSAVTPAVTEKYRKFPRIKEHPSGRPPPKASKWNPSRTVLLVGRRRRPLRNWSARKWTNRPVARHRRRAKRIKRASRLLSRLVAVSPCVFLAACPLILFFRPCVCDYCTMRESLCACSFVWLFIRVSACTGDEEIFFSLSLFNCSAHAVHTYGDVG